MNFEAYYRSRVPGLEQANGDYHRGPCPIHGGKRDSLSVNLKTGGWKCFSECGEGGDAYSFEEKLTQKPFKKIVREVAELLGDHEKLEGPPDRKKEETIKRRVVATYDYRDIDGTLLYQVVRYDPKGFNQRRPCEKSWAWGLSAGGYIKKAKDYFRAKDGERSDIHLAEVKTTLYRLPEIADCSVVCIVEGEKDSDALWAIGIPATCNSGGAGKFTAAMADRLKGKTVIIIPDQDEKGLAHCDVVGGLLLSRAEAIKVVYLPNGAKDPSEFLSKGGTADQLIELIQQAKPWHRRVAEKKEPPKVMVPMPMNLHDMLARYVILVGTQSVWDDMLGEVMPSQAVKFANAVAFTEWVKHDERRRIHHEDLVFAPQGCPSHQINIYRGLEMQPDPSKTCRLMVEHIRVLCNGDDELTWWLTAWLAHPLQNPGAKLKTAVVMHGGQGSGKSILFEAVASIYGKYGIVVTQTQIESQYNGWASGKLFVVGDEVVSQSERVHVKNRLKSLITGDRIMIEEKYQSSRYEENHMNIVFLSNMDVPVLVEKDDRRHCVIETKQIQPGSYYEALTNEAKNGGIEAFYDYLLNFNTKSFNEHTKPPGTAAKEELVRLSATSTERFLEAWKSGNVPVPYGSAGCSSLYLAYKVWAKENGEKRVETQVAFGREVGRHLTRVNSRWNLENPRLAYVPNGAFDSKEAEAFDEAIKDYLKQEQERRL